MVPSAAANRIRPSAHLQAADEGNDMPSTPESSQRNSQPSAMNQIQSGSAL